MPQRILLVYTKAGGGHYSLALTLYRLLRQLEPSAEIELFNVFEVGPRWIGQAIEDGYNYSVQKQRWIFTIFSSFNSNKPAISTWARVLGSRLGPRINEYLERFQPDKLIYCYPVNHGFRRLRYLKQRKPKTLTIVSDFYSPHIYWFLDTKDQYVVASPEAYTIARRNRIPSENLHFFQNLIDPKFGSPLPAAEVIRLKDELGLQHPYTVLITGGGAGLKITWRLVQELLKLEGINLLVVCGYNQRLLKQLEALKARRNLQHLHLFGYTNQMYELINVSNVVVTKAGPAAIAEILSQHKEMIVCDYIWPQERGNVELLQQEHLGYYIRNPRRIAEKINLLKRQETPSEATPTPNDAVKLAQFILEM
ncbi:glycosyltransferase [Meiothermus granaticius]|uniref:Processive diacylglycerol beta-glucosyltransferase n=1 Tax=Meiothermus granaticius NBRC 107808 TaxID=1227551 RepID=A0A399FB74_9DEIN|nr:glycosyltransferase [Meiothermus granaticius]RIH93867.1 Processive diacylglycerol beta-glucosyltransferase [Meiothermus granaticius NBRC 107808]GEM86363.1 galactosyldiacylglycerol synthase [Meiothermus granaticius NBRC 107808]